MEFSAEAQDDKRDKELSVHRLLLVMVYETSSDATQADKQQQKSWSAIIRC